MSAELDRLLAIAFGRDHWARVEALEKLGEHPEAAAALAELLDDEKECRHTRGAAIGALARMGTATVAGPLKRRLLYDADIEVRIAAARAIGQLRLATAAGALRHVIKRAEDTELVAAAERALDALS